MVQPTCNATNSTIAENSWGSKLENVLVNSTWHYLYHPCHIWQMSILNDSSNFWNFYFWKKHCCCGNGEGTYQISSRCIDKKMISKYFVVLFSLLRTMEDGGEDRTVIDCWQNQLGQMADFFPLLTF